MSWDLHVMKLADPKNPKLRNWNTVQIGPRDDVIAGIKKTFPEANFRDLPFGIWETPEGSVEFTIGTDPCEGFMISIRGGPDAIARIGRMLDDMGLQAWDPQSESLFDTEEAQRSLGEWQDYRDSLEDRTDERD